MKPFKQRDISLNVSDEQCLIPSVVFFISRLLLGSFSYCYQFFVFPVSCAMLRVSYLITEMATSPFCL